MDVSTRIEQGLDTVLRSAETPLAPALLCSAIRHAVFPGGARIRPQLCIAVAGACGDDDPALSTAAASAIELLHCASLVHDDLPCFDNADTRRGKPSVHRAFGERLAVLAGDALIVQAQRAIIACAQDHPQRALALMEIISAAVGGPEGIIAGQAWECEPKVDLRHYLRAKTGALFGASTAAGAVAAGASPVRWRDLGDRLGEAYQVADDIRDVVMDSLALGKPAGQDENLGRPSSARELGLCGALQHFDQLIQSAVDAVPSCLGAHRLRSLVRAEAERLVPKAWSTALAQNKAPAISPAMALAAIGAIPVTAGMAQP
jgi:geranylgeranyl diphosphate synthase, type II